ncbi:uncharacterized protein FIBRA_07749 [Fibroporia radiculosa]|uniref:Uncharacterized protein n=1 Tax=Fibroporia radiculosa TaxID=599839 RepID=J4GFF9_9APHY|nr:uncharacterized protein FIBRA_07749 [Fibroporia radiculosa]CCM05523.1 predicted protein [Fibroporia radiculosa]
MPIHKKKYTTPNVQHFSLNPPGVKSYLTFHFKPRWDLLSRKDALAASKYVPYPTLPCVLIPIPDHPLRPPVMHYGWIADIDFLLELAKELNCVRMYMCSADLYGPDDDDLDEEDEDTVDKECADSAPAQELLTGTNKPERGSRESKVQYAARLAGWDEYRTLLNVVQIIAKGFDACPRTLSLSSTLFCDDTPIVISVFTNYDLDNTQLPTTDVLDELARRLGLQGNARWYLDSSKWRWDDNGQPY